MMTFRGWKVGLLLLLTVLLVVPLWQLSSHSSAGYYKQQAQSFYDNVSRYFTHEQEIYNNTLYQDGSDNVHSQYNFSTPCDNFPDTEGILLVMKTGATEAFAKLPTQLITNMQCLPDFLLFSDLVRFWIHPAQTKTAPANTHHRSSKLGSITSTMSSTAWMTR